MGFRYCMRAMHWVLLNDIMNWYAFHQSRYMNGTGQIFWQARNLQRIGLSVPGVPNTVRVDCKGCLTLAGKQSQHQKSTTTNEQSHLRKARAVIDLGHTLLPPPLSKTDPVVHQWSSVQESAWANLVVEACAIMFPPMGFLGSAWGWFLRPGNQVTWFMLIWSPNVYLQRKLRCYAEIQYLKGDSTWNIAPPSTWATTWLVITTATPNSSANLVSNLHLRRSKLLFH